MWWMTAALVLALVPLGGMRATPVAAQKDELPDGPGKKILQASCTSCHELTPTTLFVSGSIKWMLSPPELVWTTRT